MAFPIFYHCTPLKVRQDPNNKIGDAAVVFDIVAIPSLLVIGILGELRLIPLPTAASYAMIGIAAVGILVWVAALTSERCQKAHKQWKKIS